MVRTASRGLQHQASAACHSAQAHLRSLSAGRTRSTQACYARAPWRAGCARKALRRRAPCRREASLLRRVAVVRRASCGLQRQASAACLAQRRRACALCLSGGGAVHKLSARARRAALGMVVLRPIEGRHTGARLLSFDARPWRDVPAAASNTKPTPHVSPVYLARLRARYHEGGGSAF